MSNAPTLEPGQKQPAHKNSSKEPRTQAGHMRFNPLHPSMELPPEQLIRLLGMEGKKSRRKPGPAPRPRQPVRPPVSPPAQELPAIIPERSTPAPARARTKATHNSHNEYERSAPPTATKKHKRLPLPALGIGVLALAAVSAYLVFGHSWDKPPAEARPAVTNKAPAAQMARPVRPAPVPASAPQPKKQAAAPAAPRRQAAPTDGPAWRSSVQSREQRLLAEAEQRLKQRLNTAQQAPEPNRVAPSPATSATAPLTVVQEPAPAGAEQRPLPEDASETTNTASDPYPDTVMTPPPAVAAPANGTPGSATTDMPPPAEIDRGAMESDVSDTPEADIPAGAEAGTGDQEAAPPDEIAGVTDGDGSPPETYADDPSF